MKTAFITGSSRGIGRAVALRLAGEGYKVIIHGVRESEKLHELKKIIEEKGGVAEIIAGDLCNLDETAALAKKVSEVDILILNASIQYRIPWQELTTKDCFEQLNCNYISSRLLLTLHTLDADDPDTERNHQLMRDTTRNRGPL